MGPLDIIYRQMIQRKYINFVKIWVSHYSKSTKFKDKFERILVLVNGRKTNLMDSGIKDGIKKLILQ
jgi:hypothetical protein